MFGAFYLREQTVQANNRFASVPNLLGVGVEEDLLYLPVIVARYRIGFLCDRCSRFLNAFSRERLGRQHRRVVGTFGNRFEFRHEPDLPSPLHCLVDAPHVVPAREPLEGGHHRTGRIP